MQKLQKIIALVSLHASFLILSGCATVFGNNTRSIKVDSQPAGAAIFVENQQYGVTPAVVTLPNYVYGGKSIHLRKAGYQSQSLTVNSRFQPVTLLNVFFCPGFLIDAATGTIVKVDENNLNFNTVLQKADEAQSQPTEK